MQQKRIDERRLVLCPGPLTEMITYATAHWVETAQKAIAERKAFFVALSGGSTPQAIYARLASEYQGALDWSKVHLFWSDERAVPPEDEKSNFHMAMHAGFYALSVPSEQIHRMHAEKEIEKNAQKYALDIQYSLKGRPFDLIMLGMGEDGHTASLFPGTKALEIEDRLIVANYLTKDKCWRMTMTFPCLNYSRTIVVYAFGAKKKARLKEVLSTQNKTLPASCIGTPTHPATWIVDSAAYPF